MKYRLRLDRKKPIASEREPESSSVVNRHQSGEPSNLVRHAVRTGGQPLDAATRTLMEQRFGHDFADVRVHSGEHAAESSAALDARAYTIGPDIVFGSGQYQPSTREGQRLVAHELAHVVQQRAGPVDGVPVGDGIALSQPGDRFERAADSMADTVAGRHGRSESGGSGVFPAGTSSDADATYASRAADDSIVVQRDAITTNRATTAGDRATQPQVSGQSDAVMARLPEVWRGFCRDWQVQSAAALAAVPEPPNPYEARDFCLALAGNTAWAMKSISVAMNPSGGVIPAVTETSGEAVRAGGSASTNGGAPPSARSVVAAVLAQQREQLEQLGTRQLFGDVAMGSSGSPQLEQDKALWQKFAPAMPFEKRASAMLDDTRRRLSSWVPQFHEQYVAWKERGDVKSKARDYELAEIATEPGASPVTKSGEPPGAGTPADRFFDMAKQDLPFTPVFKD